MSSRYRHYLASLFEDKTAPIKAAEIGVFAGDTSAFLLRAFPSMFLNMVDSWQEHPSDSDYVKSGDALAKYTQSEWNDWMLRAVRAVEPYKERTLILNMPSEEAATHVADGSLDLVFIDAEHTYPAVTKDIALWYPKVKPGGILSGHDYWARSFPGVVQAVDEWIAQVGLPLGRGGQSVWWVRKPLGENTHA